MLSPNMLRFLALQFVTKEQTLVVKVGNLIVSSNNRARLFTRVTGATIIGLVTSLFLSLSYGVLLVMIYFDMTENCGYKCSDYFEQLPKEGPVEIYGEELTGHLVIAGNDDARQIKIYTPSPASE